MNSKQMDLDRQSSGATWLALGPGCATMSTVAKGVLPLVALLHCGRMVAVLERMRCVMEAQQAASLFPPLQLCFATLCSGTERAMFARVVLPQGFFFCFHPDAVFTSNVPTHCTSPCFKG